MKIKFFFIILSVLALFIYLSCTKDKTQQEDPHNHSLLNVSLEKIKTTLYGNWLLKKSRICGFAGCTNQIFPNGQEDIFKFLPNDSVQRIKADGQILVNTKAVITKERHAGTSDSIWVYEMYGGAIAWGFLEIKNDTLICPTTGVGGFDLLIKQ
jgi:hypothetical protein